MTAILTAPVMKDSLQNSPARRAPRGALAGWAFASPAIALLLAFLIFPFLLALVFSFTNLRFASPLPTRFVGLDNYTDLFSDPEFLQALVNNIVFTAVIVPVQTAVALGLALAANQRLRGITVFRAIFFSPVVAGLSVAATIWFLLYDPNQGLINGMLRFLSGGRLESQWLQSPTMALPAIIVMSIWASAGFQMIILLAALQDVSVELHEAASLDGANRLQRFRYITLPAIRNTLIFVATVTTVYAFRLFDQVYIMTNGGPSGHTNTILLQLVKVGYERSRVGSASALAVVFFLIVLGITLLQRRLVKERQD